MIFKSKYVQLLEQNIQELKSRISVLEAERERLVARLLLKNSVPDVPVDELRTPEDLLDMNLFEDEITDTRKVR